MHARPADESSSRGTPIDPVGPLISCVLFGYYGFFAGLLTTDNSGATVPLFVAFVWTLRVAAILFAACACMSFIPVRRGELWAGLAGVIATAGLLGILIWDALDNVYQVACPTWLLAILVIWNGFTSVRALRDTLRDTLR
jgi:hypothetical protein